MYAKASVIRVFVVDGDAQTPLTIIELIRELSVDTPYELTVIPNYEGPLAAIEQRQHDVVLLGLRLDNRSGIELLREAGSDPSESPIIVLSRTVNAEIYRQALLAGATDVLTDADLTTRQLERVFRFIREQRRLRLALQESDTRYRNLFETSPMPMWVYGPGSLNIVDVSAAALAHYQYAREEFLRWE